MRTLYSTVCLLLLSMVSAAQVTIRARAQQNAEGSCILSLQVVPSHGVHVYAGNPEQKLDAPVISLDNETVRVNGSGFAGESALYKDPVFEGKTVKVFNESFTITRSLYFKGNRPAMISGKLTCYAGRGEEFIPLEIPFEVIIPGGTVNQPKSLKLASVDLDNPLNRCGEKADNEKSLAGIFLLGFLGGLVALFTPCVFPMVPVTVSFFTSRATTKKKGIANGLIYGLFIFLIYAAAALPFHFVHNLKPELLNNIATSVPLNLLFFFIFLAFALSFFGFFEIRLPASIANRTDSKSGLGSLVGIFCMALTLVIVSFSCTGPILGSLLVGSVSGGAWQLTAGLCGFGIALALPFGLFAVFPQLLKSLPRSGAWLDTVKKTLAFIELALAFKFLSNADLVMHWGILKRELFIAGWIIIFLALGIYFIISLRKPWRLVMGSIAFLWCIYLVPGLSNTPYANLSLLSGMAPPLSYSIYREPSHHVKADVVNDYEAALRLAKSQHKKLLIDFTGWACVNCRKMEEQVWTKPAVAESIRDNFILLSLYVDDKAKLPENERTAGLQSVGDKWAKFQSENFGKVTQPLYAVLDENERLVTPPAGYTPGETDFLRWLNCAAP